MGFFRKLTNFANARNVWNGIKNGVSNIYTPIKKVVHGVSSVSNAIDGFLDKAADFGVPSSLVDLIRENPIYSTARGGIQFIDDLVERDLPRLGSAVSSLVEHNILERSAQGLGENVQAVRSAGQSLAQRPSFGFTPNRGPTARQAITNSAVS